MISGWAREGTPFVLMVLHDCSDYKSCSTWETRKDKQMGSRGLANVVGTMVTNDKICVHYTQCILCLNNPNNQSDPVYPNSSVPIKISSDCETCGLLNPCK